MTQDEAIYPIQPSDDAHATAIAVAFRLLQWPPGEPIGPSAPAKEDLEGMARKVGYLAHLILKTEQSPKV